MAEVDPVTVVVRTVDGKKFTLQMDQGAATTVADVKAKVCGEHNFLEEGLKLIHKGKVPEPATTLTSLDYNTTQSFVIVGKRKGSLAANSAKKRRTDPAPQPASTPPPVTPPPSTSRETPGAPSHSTMQGQVMDGLRQLLQGTSEEGADDFLRSLATELDEEELGMLLGEDDDDASYSSADGDADAEGPLVIRQLAQLREQLSDPDALPEVMRQIQEDDPALYAAIEGNPERFTELMNGQSVALEDTDLAAALAPRRSDDLPAPTEPAATTSTALTAADNEAIQRLMALAQVSEDTAKQAYLVMGKNEEAAANMLFD